MRSDVEALFACDIEEKAALDINIDRELAPGSDKLYCYIRPATRIRHAKNTSIFYILASPTLLSVHTVFVVFLGRVGLR